MKCIALAMAFTFAALAQQPDIERDYSTPAKRLVGRWQSADLGFQGLECDYYGPIDENTKSGAFTRYRRVGFDKKIHQPTWKVSEFKYQVVSEDPANERVTVKLLFNDGDSRVESYYIEHDGAARTSHIVLAGMETSRKNLYMDNKNQSCR
jgi:hypothetical protein